MMKIARFIVTACCLMLISCTSQRFILTDQEKIKILVDQQRDTGLDEYKLFRAPSYPEEIKRLVPEWAETEYLVLAIQPELFDNEAIIKFYLDIIQVSIDYTNVFVLVDEKYLGNISDLVSKLEERGLGRFVFDDANQHCIRIFPSTLNSNWIRDYGPVFSINTNNEICIIDAIYSDTRLDAMQIRKDDDQIPTVIANLLQSKSNQKIKTVRSPLFLSGGDFQYDGVGNAIVSTQTLLNNGSDIDLMNTLFRHYYGLEEVAYLEALPGKTVKHVDMFVKIVDENTILIGDYIQVTEANQFQTTPYIQYLEKEVGRILKNNRLILERAYPNKKIITVPMPPLDLRISNEILVEMYKLKLLSNGYTSEEILSMDEEEIESKYVALLSREKLEEKNYPSVPSADDIEALNRMILVDYKRDLLLEMGYDEIDLPKRNVEHIESLFNSAVNSWVNETTDIEIRSMIDLDQLSLSTLEFFDGLLLEVHERMIQEEVETSMDYILMKYPDAYSYIYRTFLNSIYINGKERNLLLVPSYTFDYSEIYENLVESIYMDVYPNTDIVYINSDEIIKYYGSIHCVTSTIPYLK